MYFFKAGTEDPVRSLSAAMASWIISVYVLLDFDPEEGFFLTPFLLAVSLALFGVLVEDSAGDTAVESVSIAEASAAAAAGVVASLGEEGGDLSSPFVGVYKGNSVNNSKTKNET